MPPPPGPTARMALLMAALSVSGPSGTVQLTTVSTCMTPSRSPVPRSSAERAAASLASSSLVCFPARIAIEPE